MTIKYYHGTSEYLNVGDYLIPRPSNLLNNEKVVFSTDIFEVALMFINKWGNDDMELGSINNQFYIRETYVNAFGNVFKLNKGFVYIVSPETFVSDERLEMKNEFISYEKVKILERIEIKNIMKEIVKSGMFKIKYCYK